VRALPEDTEVECELHKVPKRQRPSYFAQLVIERYETNEGIAVCFECVESIKTRFKLPKGSLPS